MESKHRRQTFFDQDNKVKELINFTKAIVFNMNHLHSAQFNLEHDLDGEAEIIRARDVVSQILQLYKLNLSILINNKNDNKITLNISCDYCVLHCSIK